jgi:spermidine synthase
MNIATPTKKVQLVLKKNQLLALRGAESRVAIDCQDGVLWITNSGESRDHILIKSDRFSPRRKGNVLIEALRDSHVDIEER